MAAPSNRSVLPKGKMSRRWLIVVLGVSAIGIGVIISTIHRSKVVVTIPTTAEAYALTESERKELERAVAEKHDPEAAYQLGKYYIYSQNDAEQGMQWMKIASDLGHAGAKAYLDQAAKTKSGR